MVYIYIPSNILDPAKNKVGELESMNKQYREGHLVDALPKKKQRTDSEGKTAGFARNPFSRCGGCVRPLETIRLLVYGNVGQIFQCISLKS